MPFHITTSTRAVAGSSTIYDDIKDTLFEVVMDRLWYQSNGMLYFCRDTLFLHQIAGQVSSFLCSAFALSMCPLPSHIPTETSISFRYNSFSLINCAPKEDPALTKDEVLTINMDTPVV